MGLSWVVPSDTCGSPDLWVSARCWGLSETSRDSLRTIPRFPTVMGEPGGTDLRFWASFFRTLLALLLLLLLLAPGPKAEGNQERLMISVRLSFCLSSYAGERQRRGMEVQSHPLPGSAMVHSQLGPPTTPTLSLCPPSPRTVQGVEREQSGQFAVVLCLGHQWDGQARFSLQRLVSLLLLLQSFFLFLLREGMVGVKALPPPCPLTPGASLQISGSAFPPF